MGHVVGVGDLGEKWGVTDKWYFFKGSENYVDIAKLKYSGQGKFLFFLLRALVPSCNVILKIASFL